MPRCCFLLALVWLSCATPLRALSLMHYNVHGNGVTNWTTNSAQVKAIGRQVAYLQPDVITFNEIPLDFSYEMTNFVKAYLPGYFLAMNSGTDGFIRSAIASRHPIMRSTKWLDSASLVPFGYTNSPSTFTRDLFEAEINVPSYAQHLHVFTTHLKATSTITNASSNPQNDANRRAAEASAISNFMVTAFLTTNANRPYVLTGDLNEDIIRPDTNRYISGKPIQRLTNGPTGLRLTTPRNPFNNDDRTISIQTSLSARFDYILPGGLLFSNIASSQVFRTDLLSPTPPGVFSQDDKTASDHLPVLMVFHNPYDTPYRLTSITASNQMVRLNWESTAGRQYQVESSSNLLLWAALSTNLTATGTNSTFSTSAKGHPQFFRIYRAP
jgi:endonuclease/exonuclease/phosphatase family metal-dependent hydrolase